MTARPTLRETAIAQHLLRRDRSGTDVGWQEDAACRDDPWPDAWFPPGEPGPNDTVWSYPRTVCGLCPVRSDCLAYAMEGREAHGMFGGLTPLQRQRLARRQELEGGAA